jgi:superfamily II DNA or RNA helicase
VAKRTMKLNKTVKPRPHQVRAIKAILSGFSRHDRGKLIMACGTGKTLAYLWSAQRLKARRVLIATPSIALVGQILRESKRVYPSGFDALAVCSDVKVAPSEDLGMSVKALQEQTCVDVTTSPVRIGEFLRHRPKRVAIVISTYASLDRVGKAQIKKAIKPFDLAIADEAHHCAGAADSMAALFLDERKIRTRRRLFATATPRVFTARARAKASDEETELYCMDDAARFGPTFHNLSFADAIEQKLIADWRLSIVVTTKPEIAQVIRQNTETDIGGGEVAAATQLAHRITLLKAAASHRAGRWLAFHNTVAASRVFVDGHSASLDALNSRIRNSWSSMVCASHVDGTMSVDRRAAIIERLDTNPRSILTVVSNCRVLGEGVDMPAADGLILCNPRRSVIELAQCMGRALRLGGTPDKIATLVVPIYIEDRADQTPEEILESSEFIFVGQVLRAIRANDSRLEQEMKAIRADVNQKIEVRRNGNELILSDRIRIHLPDAETAPRLSLREFERGLRMRVCAMTNADSAGKKREILRLAMAGKPKPKLNTTLGRVLCNYAYHKAQYYDAAFDSKIRKLRPDWFVTPSDRIKQKQEILIRMARQAKPRPKAATPMGSALCGYTNTKSDRYDAEFDSEIRQLRPAWFAVGRALAMAKRKKIFSMALGKAPRPHHSSKLGQSFYGYTNPKASTYDAGFDSQIRKLRPDWFVTQYDRANEKKARLMELGAIASDKPKHHETLGRALYNYTYRKSETYDAAFDSKIRKLKPDWFRLRSTGRHNSGSFVD